MMAVRRFVQTFVITGLSGLSVLAQQGTVLRTTTYGVRIDALVSDGAGPIAGLQADDFDVVDKGIPQKLDAAEIADHVAVVVAIDIALGRAPTMQTYMYEVRPDYFAQILRGCQAFLGALAQRDRAALIAVGDRILPLVPLTENAGEWRGALQRLQVVPPRAVPLLTDGRGAIAFSHETDGLMPQVSFWDGALAAASLVARDPGRPLVLMVGDGIDDASWLSRTQVSTTLAGLGIAVDFVQTPWRRFHYGVAAPEDLPKKTGGVLYKTDDSKLAEKFKERLNYLRQSYVLTYEPRGVATNDGWHDVVVKVRGRNATVKARPGYYATRPAK